MSSQKQRKPEERAKQPEPPPPPTPTFPRVYRDQIVSWYPGGDRTMEPRPAVVIRVNQETVDLGVIDDTNAYVMVKTGVRHVDDREASDSHREDAGGWEHNLLTNALYAVLPSLASWSSTGPDVRRDAARLVRRAAEPAEPPPPAATTTPA